jgi:CHAD domain-containing protein
VAIDRLDDFIKLEPKVLKGDKADPIHDMRVASRRTQEAFDLLYPAPQTKKLKKLRRAIKEPRCALGELRNYDVQLELVEKRVAAKRLARRQMWIMIRDYLVERRAEEQSTALRKLGKAHLGLFYVRLKEQVKQALRGAESNGNNARPADAPVPGAWQDNVAASMLQQRLTSSLERLWSDFERKAHDARTDHSIAAVHGLRIAAKRLRYLIEIIAEFSAEGASEVLESLRSMQQSLGNWHDIVVLDQMLVEMLARPDFLASNLEIAIQIEKLILSHRRDKDRCIGEFAQVADSEAGQRMQDWVAGLVRPKPAEHLAETAVSASEAVAVAAAEH